METRFHVSVKSVLNKKNKVHCLLEKGTIFSFMKKDPAPIQKRAPHYRKEKELHRLISL